MFNNQKTIIISKSDTCNSPYVKIMNSSIDSAISTLSNSGVCFWLYLIRNKHGYRLRLSSKDVIEKCGFSRNTYSRVFKELYDKGFILDGSKRNEYIFRESPFTMLI